MAKKKIARNLRIKVVGETQDVPFGLRAEGFGCNKDRYYYVAAPTKGKGVLVREAPKGALTGWVQLSGKGSDVPRRAKGAISQEKAAWALQKAADSIPRTTRYSGPLKGVWRGYIECHSAYVDVVLYRDVTSYGRISIVGSHPTKGSKARWDVAVNVASRWFTTGKAGVKKVGSFSTLKAAAEAGYAAMAEVVKEGCWQTSSRKSPTKLLAERKADKTGKSPATKRKQRNEKRRTAPVKAPKTKRRVDGVNLTGLSLKRLKGKDVLKGSVDKIPFYLHPVKGGWAIGVTSSGPSGDKKARSVRASVVHARRFLAKKAAPKKAAPKSKAPVKKAAPKKAAPKKAAPKAAPKKAAPGKAPKSDWGKLTKSHLKWLGADLVALGHPRTEALKLLSKIKGDLAGKSVAAQKKTIKAALPKKKGAPSAAPPKKSASAKKKGASKAKKAPVNKTPGKLVNPTKTQKALVGSYLSFKRGGKLRHGRVEAVKPNVKGSFVKGDGGALLVVEVAQDGTFVDLIQFKSDGKQNFTKSKKSVFEAKRPKVKAKKVKAKKAAAPPVKAKKAKKAKKAAPAADDWIEDAFDAPMVGTGAKTKTKSTRGGLAAASGTPRMRPADLLATLRNRAARA